MVNYKYHQEYYENFAEGLKPFAPIFKYQGRWEMKRKSLL